MTKLVLSTSNIMGAGASVFRRPQQKSNVEFTGSLRKNFSAHQHLAIHQHYPSNTNSSPQTNDDAEKHHGERPPYTWWTSRAGSTIYIPSLEDSHAGLVEERSRYEITVKLFFLPNKPASCRCAQTRDAIKMVLKELNVPSIDLLIISFPGIAFDAEDEDFDESGDYKEVNGTSPGQKAPQSPSEAALGEDAVAEDIDTQIKTWSCLEELHDEGVIERLGLSEFGTDRLSKFLAKTRVRPSVNQINVRDCCVVPKPLILFAKKENVELLTHNDSTNILPKGTIRDLLGQRDAGAGVLSEREGDGGLSGDVEPQWVIKYTAVVKDRGVIENKGYFAVADLKD